MSLRDKVLDKIRKTMGWSDSDIQDNLDESSDTELNSEEYKEYEEDYNDLVKEYKKSVAKKRNWFCPCCGSVMRYFDPEIDNDYFSKHIPDVTDEVFCTNDKCTWNSTPLKIHHPTSYDRSAGDSWSISWLK